jgi:FAD/FMN-containing dehydrogenase/Fe-S oxidoreductase
VSTAELGVPAAAWPRGTSASSEAPEIEALRSELRDRVRGETRFDAGSRGAYATDSSNYRQPPLGVVVPATVDDAVTALEVCRRHRAPVLSRGGGTSLAGQATNTAVVLDWSKRCAGLVSIDPAARTCVVEPGIGLDDLNRQLAGHGLMFGPRPSTHRACTVGGMVGNNSCGATAQAYGKTVDNVRRLEVITYDGTRIWVGPTSDEEYAGIVRAGGRRAELYQGLRRLRDDHLALIRTRYPDIPRRVSGYNLDSLLPENHFDLARALVGSEGTLVTVLHAELDLVPVPAAKAMVVLGYPDIAAAADAVPRVLTHEPWQLEGMDQVLVGLEQSAHLAGEAIGQLPPGGGWLVVQLAGDTQDEADERARALLDDVRRGDRAPHVTLIEDPAREEQLITVREAGLGATAHPTARHETWEGWEDAAVPPERLGDYLRDFRQLLDEFGYEQDETSLYGHFGHGCVHTRIPFELRTAAGIARYRSFVETAADLVVWYGGSLSGEHGDGQSRGELLTRMFGPDVVDLFGQVKSLFDPDNRLNPGKVVHADPLDSNLRLGTAFVHGFRHDENDDYFAYPDDDHRFTKSALRCVGIGSCRATSSEADGGQVMCPSYMVTREEEHSTRGRARVLFEMVRGEVITDGWRSTEVRDALDLCLACKGCKSDCPAKVDMATYKAEFLAHHYRNRLRPVAHYSMGWLPLWAHLAGKAPQVVNRVAATPGVAAVAKRLGGVAAERDLPVFAPEPFTRWWRGRSPYVAGIRRPAPNGPVVLWPDTFTNAFHPGVARAAVDVLEAAGFDVRVPRAPVCCGLTWVSTGQLATAQRVLRRTLRVLRDDIRSGVPVVGLEPSCTAVFRADGPELLDGDQDMRRLAQQTYTMAGLLAEKAPDWQPPVVDVRAVRQEHCHQHAVLGSGPDDDLLERAGVDTETLRSGCCGLAGNFGFERGHYPVSRAAGERVLLPRVRAAGPGTVVLADGFSCRTQIEQGDTGRTAVHLAELLAAGLRGNDLGDHPERVLADRPGRPHPGTHVEHEEQS